MKLRHLTLGLAILTFTIGFAQEETEQERECKRMRFLAGEALKVENYAEATMYYIKGDSLCGGYDKANYDRLIGSLLYATSGETDATKQAAYMDTIRNYYDKVEKLGFYDRSSALTRAYYELQSPTQDGKKIDGLLKEGIKLAGKEIDEAYVQIYYQNIYVMYTNQSGAEKTALKQRLIKEYFELSKLVIDYKMTLKTQESLNNFFNDVVKTCADLIPELKGFMKSLPQDNELKKTAVNNFLELMDQKGCQETPEYEMLIDTLIKIDPSAGAVIAKGKLLRAKKKYSESSNAFKEAIQMSSNEEEKADLEYFILLNTMDVNNYKTAYSLALGISGKYKSDALKIAASCVYNLANSCGTSTFDRKCNYYLAAEIAEQAGNSSFAAKCRANFPTTAEIFDAGKQKGESVFLSCWNRSVTIQ